MKRFNRRVPYMFLLPYLILFVLFLVFPFVYSLLLSFFVQRAGNNIFVGLQNYIQALNDAAFWSGMGRVFYFGGLQVVVMMILALGIALLLDSPFIKGKAFFRLVYFLPYAVPGVIAAIMWGFLYSPQLDPILGFFGFFTGGKPLNFLSPNILLYGILIIGTWEWAGYNMTIYFANLTSIPLDLYDAAKMDGCNELQLAVHIKVPLIRQTIIMTIILTIIGSLQLFNEPFVLNTMTSISPSFTPNMDIYNTAFSYGNLTYAATLSIILTAITFVASMLFINMTSSKDDEPTPEIKSSGKGVKDIKNSTIPMERSEVK